MLHLIVSNNLNFWHTPELVTALVTGKLVLCTSTVRLRELQYNHNGS